MQEVVAEEDAALEQQEEEADAIPDDAGLLHRQRTVLVPAHALGWQRGEGTVRHLGPDSLWGMSPQTGTPPTLYPKDPWEPLSPPSPCTPRAGRDTGR